MVVLVESELESVPNSVPDTLPDGAVYIIEEIEITGKVVRGTEEPNSIFEFEDIFK